MLVLIFLWSMSDCKARANSADRGAEENQHDRQIFMAIFGPFKALALLHFEPVITCIMNVSIKVISKGSQSSPLFK